MKVVRNGEQAAIKGPAASFTGDVRVDCVVPATEPARASVRVVTFAPGARTFWHTHPAGQTLVVTNGVGWTRCDGGPKTAIRTGDIIVCPAAHRHWHGATATSAMTHIAITELYEGREVDWMEPVDDADYLGE